MSVVVVSQQQRDNLNNVNDAWSAFQYFWADSMPGWNSSISKTSKEIAKKRRLT